MYFYQLNFLKKKIFHSLFRNDCSRTGIMIIYLLDLNRKMKKTKMGAKKCYILSLIQFQLRYNVSFVLFNFHRVSQMPHFFFVTKDFDRII